MKMNLKQGDLENIILNALWDLETAGMNEIYVGDVQDKIKTQRNAQKEWAYTTVKTVLDRLVDKEVAQRVKEGKKFRYASLVKRDEAASSALSKVLRQFFQNDITRLESALAELKAETQPAGAGLSVRSAAFLRQEQNTQPLELAGV